MMDDPNSILLVEDDVRLAELIRDYLHRHGFSVSIVSRGDEGKTRIIAEQPGLVILDLMLPGIDGLRVCREVRPHYQGPVLMLTAREDDTDQIVGLEIGADDYVKKPVEPRVLLARIRALQRRFGIAHGGEEQVREREPEELAYGQLRINKGSRTVHLHDRPVDLTSSEFSLLWLLASNGGNILDRETLFMEMKGIPYDGIDRSVDIAISRLRRKLGDNAAKPFRIKTVWGQGYLFVKDGWRCIGDEGGV